MRTALVPIQSERAPQQLVYAPHRRESISSVTVAELCEQYLQSKQVLLESGEYSAQLLQHARRALDRARRFFGDQAYVEEIKSPDFMAFRNSLPKTWGVHTLGNEVTRIRALFNFAFNAGLVDQPIRFGPDFKRPSARAFRKAKREKPNQMLEREEILAVLEAAPLSLRPLILLGINCGFGNSDVGRIEFKYLDLDKGWHTFARPKTEVERRCPLWPETIDAIRRYLPKRSKPVTDELAQRVFLTGSGRAWAQGESGPAVQKKFSKLLRKLGMKRRQCSFYALRRSFETIAGETTDQVAVDAIMGHVPKQNDMAAIYRQRISDERLLAVTDFVRKWLFDGPQLDPQQAAAIEIRREWEPRSTLDGADVQSAIDRLRIPQTELGRLIGRNSDWLNAVACGRESLSSATEGRIRRLVEQLAEGITPCPSVDDKPGKIPATAEVAALLNKKYGIPANAIRSLFAIGGKDGAQ